MGEEEEEDGRTILKVPVFYLYLVFREVTQVMYPQRALGFMSPFCGPAWAALSS